jgi:DNA-binding transcriptional regulator YiaG
VKPPISLRVGDREYLLTNWAKMKGISREALYFRMKSGWTPEQIIGEEPRPKREAKPRKTVRNPQGPRPRENKLIEPVRLRAKLKAVVITDHKATGEAAKEIRKLAGLSQEDAVKSLGWSLAKISEMERGQTKWKQKDIDHFNKVAKGWVKNGNDDRTTAVNDGQSGAGTIDV